MVALDGLEPSLPKEPDFESGVSTNSTTAPFLRGEVTKEGNGSGLYPRYLANQAKIIEKWFSPH